MKLAVVVFDGVQALDIAGPMDVFAEANALLPPHKRYEISLVGVRPDSVTCSNGMQISVPVDYRNYADNCDLLLVAGGPRAPEMQPDPEFLSWLHDKALSTQRFGAVCNGVFLLAHAGLLDGREVTTHWSETKRLQEHFPRACVRPDKIFVRDGSLFTCGGVTAGIDLCLALVAEDLGHALAVKVAKRLIVYIRRDGGQSQYSPYLAVGPEEDSIVSKALRYVNDHIADAFSIEELADAVGVSRRTFSRTFAKHAKVSPSVFVEQVRVDFARKLLEQTDVPLKTIAFRCGFHSSTHMRMIFSRRLDITPKEYRLRFLESEGASRDAAEQRNNSEHPMPQKPRRVGRISASHAAAIVEH
ncbi:MULTISPECIES: GlxA family transcriptional regulator [unclassified Cupriavidus]|uniref:GlxA family transcriptional regulator n=1 Tax=unclassified Cupriavidus TaxID=2640874 RepID=UPI00088A391E|nr:GlxA family transcriptional regulator [Cupriavidus sp. YR651]SDC99820.1 transcriptional regulator, AraC family with amidase-like domain [Cupriavidus sp. YR651]